MSSDILIVIPAFNVGSEIHLVLEKLPRTNSIVIDDGSTDKTKKVASKYGFDVIQHSYNLGLSAAIDTGIKYALRNGFSHILLIDADGQHPAELYKEFYSAMDSHDFVLGDRFSNINEVPHSKISSNLFASLMIKNVTGVFIRDTSCGYRGFRISRGEKALHCSGYSFIFSQLISNILVGILPTRVKVPPIYDTTEPLVTKHEEVEALCGALSQYSPSNKFVLQLMHFLKKRDDIKITIDNVTFIAKHIEEWDSYLFDTEISNAEVYYGN